MYRTCQVGLMRSLVLLIAFSLGPRPAVGAYDIPLMHFYVSLSGGVDGIIEPLFTECVLILELEGAGAGIPIRLPTNPLSIDDVGMTFVYTNPSIDALAAGLTNGRDEILSFVFRPLFEGNYLGGVGGGSDESQLIQGHDSGDVVSTVLAVPESDIDWAGYVIGRIDIALLSLNFMYGEHDGRPVTLFASEQIATFHGRLVPEPPGACLVTSLLIVSALRRGARQRYTG